MATFEEIQNATEGKEFDCIKSDGENGFKLFFVTSSPNIGPTAIITVPNLEEVTVVEK